MAEKIPVIAVVGPTATGKTALGAALASKYGGEIVSCDSMQIYRGLPIGTAQPTPEERRQAPHHLVDFLEWDKAFSVSDYVDLAGRVIGDIYARGKLPILVGGTGLYARSLLRGFSFEETARDEALRQELFHQGEEEGPEALYRRLEELDPAGAAQIHPHNVKRVVRALEYCLLSGEPFSNQAERSKQARSPYRYHMLCLNFANRETLYRRIDRRVDAMVEAGLLEEARGFFTWCQERGVPATAAQAIGYKELFPYFRGKVSLEQAVDDIKRESRRYAKRQITWFQREEHVSFLYLDQCAGPSQVLEKAEAILREQGLLPAEAQGGTT